MRSAVNDYLEHGFQAIKFGWGVFGHDIDLDIALVEAARKEAGPGIDLMVDAGWYGTNVTEPFRPRSIRESTGTPLLSARCSTASRTGIAIAACRNTPPPPVAIAPGHEARCLRIDEALATAPEVLR